jgi:NitT/TauT family transport system permease protein
MRSAFRVLCFYLILLLIWEGIFRLHFWPAFLFPSPLQVFETLVNGFYDKSFLIGIGISMERILLGFGISLVLGIVVGFCIGSFQMLDGTIGPLLNGLRSLPSICWFPLGLLWFGLNENAINFVVIMGAAFCITLATDDGVKNISPIYLRAASTMGATGLKRFWYVILPAALPSIITGMKLGWSFAWRSLMAGEMLYVSLGLGHLLMMGRELNDISQMFAVMLVIMALGLLVDKVVFGLMEREMRIRWGLNAL